MGMREKLIELLMDAMPSCYSDTFASQIADNLIANGVTIPVRCKDCKHCAFGYIRSYLGWCSEWKEHVKASGFCHKGERRTDE